MTKCLSLLYMKSLGSVDYAECGVQSAEFGVWKMQSVENEECGKYGVWKTWNEENAECGECRVWKFFFINNL